MGILIAGNNRYFMSFFPSREYVVTDQDTIKFQLQDNRLSAPHIVTFLNGAPDFPLGNVRPPIANPPFPYSQYPNLPILVLNPAAVFPTDPILVRKEVKQIAHVLNKAIGYRKCSVWSFADSNTLAKQWHFHIGISVAVRSEQQPDSSIVSNRVFVFVFFFLTKMLLGTIGVSTLRQ